MYLGYTQASSADRYDAKSLRLVDILALEGVDSNFEVKIALNFDHATLIGTSIRELRFA